jgi:hypothetical protein
MFHCCSSGPLPLPEHRGSHSAAEAEAAVAAKHHLHILRPGCYGVVLVWTYQARFTWYE